MQKVLMVAAEKLQKQLLSGADADCLRGTWSAFRSQDARADMITSISMRVHVKVFLFSAKVCSSRASLCRDLRLHAVQRQTRTNRTQSTLQLHSFSVLLLAFTLCSDDVPRSVGLEDIGSRICSRPCRSHVRLV